jgi:DNA-binding NarL/FixJ family response regulator
MDQKIRIVIADDHPVALQGLRAILATAPDIAVVGEALDGAAAWNFIQSNRPDVALLDMRLPVIDGLGVARRIRHERNPVPFLFLTMWRDEAIFNEAMSLGCSGYLLKECAAEEIVAAIRAVAAGRRYLSPAVSEFVLQRSERQAALNLTSPGLDLLTPAERRVLHLIAENRTTKEIADTLKVSPRTVDNQRASISAKLGLQGSHSLLRFAFEHHWDL